MQFDSHVAECPGCCRFEITLFFENVFDFLEILRIDKEVDILGKTWFGIEGHGNPTHKGIPHLLSFQFQYQPFEVFEYVHAVFLMANGTGQTRCKSSSAPAGSSFILS
jgi:hypothetical protein